MQRLLEGLYPPEEIRAMWMILLQDIMGWSSVDALRRGSDTVSESELLKLHFAIKELALQRPIQYVTGQAHFYGLILQVHEGVLIPRPETEELTDWIVCDARVSERVSLRIADLCTGSGCIAIALSKSIPDSYVYATDVSEEALRQAEANALRLGVSVIFERHDLLSASITLPADLDIIVSNPPYVRFSEKKSMQANVLNYEPESALFVSDEDPLIFYRLIMEVAAKSLKRGGFLYFEINEAMGEEMRKLASEKGFEDFILKKDLNGRDRMCRMSKSLQ
jgi:release factor glutamine methyltransferase